MDLSLPAVVGWLFVAIFATVAVIVLLDLAGVRRIADDSQRKWLFRGLIVSVVTAVGGLGTAHINGLKADSAAAEPKPQQIAAATPSPVPTQPAPTPSATPTPQPSPSPAVSDIPDGLRIWADKTLGPRPTLAEIDANPYPDCVDELNSGPAEDATEDKAAQCTRLLDLYRFNYLGPYYAKKTAYELKLSRYEKLLRPDPDDPRFQYIAAELKRLTKAEWRRIAALDAMLIEERADCRKNKCRKQE